MAQSYNNLAVSTILSATDEILGVDRVEQTLGTSISGKTSAILSAPNSLDVTVDGVTYTAALSVNDDPYEIAADIEADVAAGAATSTSDVAPLTNISAGTDDSFNIDVNGDGVQTVTLTGLVGLTTGALIAAEMQTQIRALTAVTPTNQSIYDTMSVVFVGGLYVLTAVGATTLAVTAAGANNVADDLKLGFTEVAAVGAVGFTARYDGCRYILTSGTAATAPATASVLVTNGAGTAATVLRLGTAQGGTESNSLVANSEVISWTFHYRFVYTTRTNGMYGSDRGFSSAAVTISSTDMAVPTDVAEATILANLKASQLKALGNATSSLTALTSQNGPVTL